MDRTNIRFFDRDINFLGEVDNYTSLFYISKWETYGEFEFHLSGLNRELIQKGNIIMLNKDGSRTGVIEYVEINQEGIEDITVKGFSLGYWLIDRITVPPPGYAYHAFNANVEDIMLALIKTNAAEPLDINRKIPDLLIEVSKNRGIKLEFQTRYKNLAEELTKLSKTSGLGWNISLDYKAKKFIFKVLEGRDLTTNQNINPPQIFSVDYDNVRKQTYIESDIGYKNMAYIAGQGEGEKREIEPLNNNLIGLDRKEIFIDARDIDGNGSLGDRGKVKLAETPQISNFECEVDSLDYKTNWNVGDRVTTANKKWKLVMHNRVTEVKEIFESGGYKVEPTFGTSIPLPSEKIKQITDTPLQESVQGPVGDIGVRGPQGYSTQYLWSGTKLGVKREDEAIYTYIELKGAIGAIGPNGTQGIQGATGIQGLKGDTGIQGTKGEIGATGTNGIAGTNGKDGAVGTKGDQGIQGVQGFKGDKGLTGDTGTMGVQGPAGNGQSYVAFQRYFIATEGQKTFTWNDGYIYPVGINAISAYINGIRIGNKAFIETSGSSLELKTTLNEGNVLFIEAMQAVKDLQGAQGLQGLKGDIGATGLIGVQGIQGIQGIKGDTGAVGAKGTTGNTGLTGTAGTNGATGTQGTQGVIGSNGLKGDVGLTGLQGIQGVAGPIGATGTQGIVGANGATGAKGDAGSQGIQGLKGNVGLQGDTGLTGQQGAVGLQGDKGDTGNQGVQGPSGNGQSYVVFHKHFIATEGQKIFSWNDGYIYPVGINAIAIYLNGSRLTNRIINETGGCSIEFKASLSEGDRIFIEAMQAVKDLQGAQGLRGDTGPQGLKGDKGDQGTTGVTGTQGNTGIQGIKGLTGNNGANGAQGVQGVKGDTGSSGIKGADGINGAKGDQGVQGIQGIKGDKGDTGLTGGQGIQGVPGITGAKGDIGATGAVGPKGDIGLVGPKGNTGVIGSTGSTGLQGLVGSTGAQGIQGVIGLTGTKGVDGAKGIQGIAGINGGKGETGTQGLQGIKGEAGTKGDTGATGIQGAQGLKGDVGATGANGTNGTAGTLIITSTTRPTGQVPGRAWIQTY